MQFKYKWNKYIIISNIKSYSFIMEGEETKEKVQRSVRFKEPEDEDQPSTEKLKETATESNNPFNTFDLK